MWPPWPIAAPHCPPLPQELEFQAPPLLPKQPPKQLSTVSRDLSGVIPHVLSPAVSPSQAAPLIGAEARHCTGSLWVRVRDELSEDSGTVRGMRSWLSGGALQSWSAWRVLGLPSIHLLMH